MKKNIGDKILNTCIAAGLAISILGGSYITYLTTSIIFEDYKKPGYEQERTATQYISLASYISGYNNYDTFQEISDYAGCNFDNINHNAIIQQRLDYYTENNSNEFVIDGDDLISGLKSTDSDFLLLEGQYYTENGDNLTEIIVEKYLGETKEETLSNGTIVRSAEFSVPNNAIWRGNKIYIRATILVPAKEEIELPPNYTLVEIGKTIETKPYSKLRNKEIHSEYETEEYILKLK